MGVRDPVRKRTEGSHGVSVTVDVAALQLTEAYQAQIADARSSS